jgi:iron complex transport system substrate-binding protein
LLLADGHAYHNAIVTDPMWRSLSAIKNGNVYEAPYRPYNWMGGPPSIQHLLSMVWLGNLMYPDVFDYDIDERVGEFYSLFFRYDPTGAELDDRMVYAKPAPASAPAQAPAPLFGVLAGLAAAAAVAGRGRSR